MKYIHWIWEMFHLVCWVVNNQFEILLQEEYKHPNTWRGKYHFALNTVCQIEVKSIRLIDEIAFHGGVYGEKNALCLLYLSVERRI